MYGVVRDQVGQTVTAEGAEVILLKGGVEVGRTPITSSRVDQNYELNMRIDQNRSGTTFYTDKAVAAGGLFSLVVSMNGALFYPIEVSGNLTAGKGGERVKLDLTLGEDEDKDGLPDTWEAWQLYQAGLYPDANGDWDLSLIDRNGDFDKDGQSNLLEYIAGTFAGDATETFGLTIKEKLPQSGMWGLSPPSPRRVPAPRSSTAFPSDEIDFPDPRFAAPLRYRPRAVAEYDLHPQDWVEFDLPPRRRHACHAGAAFRRLSRGHRGLALESESDAGWLHQHAAASQQRHAGMEQVGARRSFGLADRPDRPVGLSGEMLRGRIGRNRPAADATKQHVGAQRREFPRLPEQQGDGKFPDLLELLCHFPRRDCRECQDFQVRRRRAGSGQSAADFLSEP